MKIAVLGGGNMGGAIAYGAIVNSVVDADGVVISHLAQKMEPFFTEFNDKIKRENSNVKAILDADLIVVAVKPWLVAEVLAEIAPCLDRQNQSIISVVAGVDFSQMAGYLEFEKYGPMSLYRVIPNTAISIGQSVNIISCSEGSVDQDGKVLSLFEKLGKTFVVDEGMMAPLTSLSSCGIAFAYRYIDAAMRGGEAVGVDLKMSLEVVMQTVKGALMMLETNGTLPQVETDKVTTKGGITLKGLEAMEREGFSESVIAGVKESR